MESVFPTVEAQSLNHWTARDNLGNSFFILYYFIFLFILYINIYLYCIFISLSLNDWLHRAGTIFVELTSAFLMSNNVWTVEVHKNNICSVTDN